MISGKEDLLQSLAEAFLLEKGTHLFYAEAAEKANNAGVRRIFQDLAGWEEKHMDFIQYLYHSVNGDLEFKSFKSWRSNAPALFTEAGIPVKDLKEKLGKPVYHDEKGAVALALKIEGRAYSLYSGLARSAADSSAQVVFRELVDEELKHIARLKEIRDWLSED